MYNKNYVNKCIFIYFLGGVILKSRILRYLAAFCSIAFLMSLLTFNETYADEPVGKMSSVYAYVLNDYMYKYGTMYTENPGDAFSIDYDSEELPNGVVYSEIVNFDANSRPYIVIFFASAENYTASCHIWEYNEEEEIAEQTAALDVDYRNLTDGQVGVFSLGASNEKRYITYNLVENDEIIYTDYYTVINGDAFKYVNAPMVFDEIGVMDFSSSYFHSGVDISQYNQNLDGFFNKLKNSAADSVTYEDIAQRLGDSDEKQIESVLKYALNFTDFDIANYTSMEEYREALNVEPNGDTFYLISEAYDLSDEIYYIRFSTDRSYYNYALLRRSDDAENGYQILKVRTDCIPLSDRELKQIKTDYDRNTLLYKKAKNSLKLGRETDDGNSNKTPLIHIEKTLNRQTRLPIICIGGGISIALLTILWVYLYSDND